MFHVLMIICFYESTAIRPVSYTHLDVYKRQNESRYINWLVFDVNPARDILGQIAAMLVKAGFGSQDKKTDVYKRQYQDYIDGKKELREINMEFNARYVHGEDMPGRSGCGYK